LKLIFENTRIIHPPAGGARSSPDRALAPFIRRQQTARRSLKEKMDKKEILCSDGSIDALGANLGIILEKCYLSTYQLRNT